MNTSVHGSAISAETVLMKKLGNCHLLLLSNQHKFTTWG